MHGVGATPSASLAHPLDWRELPLILITQKTSSYHLFIIRSNPFVFFSLPCFTISYNYCLVCSAEWCREEYTYVSGVENGRCFPKSLIFDYRSETLFLPKQDKKRKLQLSTTWIETTIWHIFSQTMKVARKFHRSITYK